VLAYLIVILVWLTIERRAIRGELREEVAEGLISPEEYAILPTFFRRTVHYLRFILTGHLGAWSRARRVHSAAVDLAFAKSLARRSPAPSRVERVHALRRKIVDLRTQAEPRVST
jgi:protease PrsW